MVWRKFAYAASVARTEAKCDFLAKSQILSTDTKPSFVDHLSGSKQNHWPYLNRASLLISISTENSMFFLTRFPHAARVFFEMATLTIVWFLRYESHFLILSLFHSFHEKCSETQQKRKPKKALKNNVKSDPKWFAFRYIIISEIWYE